MERKTVYHVFEPVFNEASEVLILGTIPSPKSIENGFYYSHPQNRFWNTISAIFSSPVPKTIDEKTELILNNKLALWDVLQSCEIKGADDSSIKSEKPNDLDFVINQSKVKHIITTGKKSFSLYNKYCVKKTGIEAICLPSTSPANCAVSLEKLITEYSIIPKLIKRDL